MPGTSEIKERVLVKHIECLQGERARLRDAAQGHTLIITNTGGDWYVGFDPDETCVPEVGGHGSTLDAALKAALSNAGETP